MKPRLFNSYGPGEIPGEYRNVIPNFIYWALLGKPLVCLYIRDEYSYMDPRLIGLLKARLREYIDLPD